MQRVILFITALILGLTSSNASATSPHLASQAVSWVVRAGSTYEPNLHWADHVLTDAAMKFVHPTDGVDDAARNGSRSQPWKTPTYAFTRLVPGDILNIFPGEYAGVAIDITSPLAQGAASAPIVVRGYGSGSVVFKATTATSLLRLRRSYWVIESIIFDMNHQAAPAIRVTTPATHVVLRGIEVRNGTAGAGVSIDDGAQDVAVLRSRIHDTWRGGASTGVACTSNAQCAGSDVCDRGAGVCRVRADGHGVFIGTGASRVLLRDNLIYDNSGDGVQCEESIGGNQVPRNVTPSLIPRDVLLEGNEISTTAANWGHTENAIDLKACHDVSVRSSAAKSSLFQGFRPASGAGGNTSSGSALVVHFEASNVLIEDARITDSCNALTIGRAFDVKDSSGNITSRQIDSVQGVTFRRNTVHGLALDTAAECDGKAVIINRVDDAELSNNTFVDLPATALTLASGIQNIPPWPFPESTGVKVSSNIVDTQAGARWVTLSTSEFTSVESRNNLFWSRSAHPTAGFAIDASATNLTGWRSTLQGQYGMSPTLTATEQELDPLLSALTAKGFPTQSGSPARNAAEPVAGEPHCGTADDIGAQESDCNTWLRQFSDGTATGYEQGDTAAIAPDGSLYVAGEGAPQGSTGTGGVFIMKLDSQGTPLWTRRTSGIGGLYNLALAVDGQGDVYATATDRESYNCDFMGNCSQAVRTLVLKFSASGQELWRQVFGARGALPLYVKDIAVHASGAVYVAGVRGWYPLFGRANQDGFLIKLDASTGQEAWTHILTQGGLEGVATSASGQVFVTGSTEAQVELTPPPYLVCAGNDPLACKDMFVAEFDANGNRLWIRRHGGADTEQPTGIAVGPSGTLYVAGSVYGSWARLNTTSYDVFGAKFDGSGNLLWVRQFGGSSHDETGEVRVDAAGALYIASSYTPTFMGNLTSNSDALVLKYDTDGELRGAWVAGTTEYERPYGLVLDGQGGFITTGLTKGSWGATLTPGPFGTLAEDAFVVRELFLR